MRSVYDGFRTAETRQYDPFDQLGEFRRGKVPSATAESIPIQYKDKNGTPRGLTFEQEWRLDEEGNWLEFRQDDNGDGKLELKQLRKHNAASDIIALAPTTDARQPGFDWETFQLDEWVGFTRRTWETFGLAAGPAWTTPKYDANGNLVIVPEPGSPDRALRCEYDAWNRLVKVYRLPPTLVQKEQLLVEYDYDGLGRMIARLSYDDNGAVTERRHFVYDQAGNLIQEQVLSPTAAAPDRCLIHREYVWGPHGLAFRDQFSGFFPDRLYAAQDVEGNVTTLVRGGPRRNLARGATNVLQSEPATGPPQARFTYDPYGRSQVSAGSPQGWNLLWRAGWRDPITGIYVGGDGAYHEGLGRHLNPSHAMAQDEGDFAENYQQAVAAADPGTISRLTPPSGELTSFQRWLTGRSAGELIALGVGFFALTLVTGGLAAAAGGALATAFGLGAVTGALLGAAFAGAAVGLETYAMESAVAGQPLTWGGAAQAAGLGAIVAVGIEAALLGLPLLLSAGAGLAWRGISWVASRLRAPFLRRSRGYISGFRQILMKARSGDAEALAEIEAAKVLRSQGLNVHFKTPWAEYRWLNRIVSRLGLRDVLNTSDFSVGGIRRWGLFGKSIDVYSPTTSRAGAVISEIAGKTTSQFPFLRQASGVYLDLSRTKLTVEKLESTRGVFARVLGLQRSWGRRAAFGRLEKLWINGRTVLP